MPTGMQTGRRTAASAMRTGAAPAGGGGAGGPLAGVKGMWENLDGKKKMIIVASVAVLVIAILVWQVNTATNKPVELFAGSLNSSDTAEIQQKLLSWNIPCEVIEGGRNILVHPRYRSMALLKLSQEGLPRRPITLTNDLVKSQTSGMVPPTAEDKKRQMLLALEGDLVNNIRQISGVADAYVKIVPKETDFGENTTSATASIMLKLYPDAKLSKKQIKGIVHMTTSSVSGLLGENVTVLDTNGTILNDRLDLTAGGSFDGEGASEGYATEDMARRKEMEKDLQRKVQTALNKFIGSERVDVQVSVELDFSQKEHTITKYGGPGNTKGFIESARSEDTETYNSGSSGSPDGIVPLSGSKSDSNDYKKSKVTIRRAIDETKVRTVSTTPTIKRISCSVMVDGVKDPEMLSRLESAVKASINFDQTRNDQVSVVSFPITTNEMLHGMANRPAGYAPESWPAAQRQAGGSANWLPIMVGVPILMIVLLVMMFYMKQKNVQREKQRLVLSSGPGATVSDISDLLADKEGKITPPPATKVNTTDQLENLAKEKPTKVAELLKSTWLSER